MRKGKTSKNNKINELNYQLELSEQKRIQLQKVLVENSVEEELPLWSMVDLLTILLIFFILLYTQSPEGALMTKKYTYKIQMDEKIDTQSTSQYFPENDSLKKLNELYPELDIDSDKNKGLEREINELQTEVLSGVDENDKAVFSVRKEENRLVFVLGERITFEEGEATLLEAYRSIPKKIAGFITNHKDSQVVVSGHTDNKPIHTEMYPSNLDLSAARAINVAKSLIINGVSPDRVSIQGFSEYQPLVNNLSPENRQANRRVEISLIDEQNS